MHRLIVNGILEFRARFNVLPRDGPHPRPLSHCDGRGEYVSSPLSRRSGRGAGGEGHRAPSGFGKGVRTTGVEDSFAAMPPLARPSAPRGAATARPIG